MAKTKQPKLRKDRIAGARREWVDFEDHEEDDCTWRVDVTFLSSGWTCIYGNGCQGVEEHKAPEKMIGCCSHGAHFTDKKDREHVVQAIKDLGPDEWQYYEVGQAKGIFEQVDKKTTKTRVVDDACIFLNRPGFSNGPGCALHQHADRRGIHFADIKPDVCWQLPLHLVNQEQDDGSMVWLLTEYDRAAWDEGGQDFGWWCTEEPEAFIGREPVYRTMEAELRKMVGDLVYEDIREYLDARRDLTIPPVAHPAEVPVALSMKPS